MSLIFSIPSSSFLLCCLVIIPIDVIGLAEHFDRITSQKNYFSVTFRKYFSAVGAMNMNTSMSLLCHDAAHCTSYGSILKMRT